MIYLDNAATTVHKPPSVLRAQRQAIRCAGNAGRGGHTLSLAAAQTLYRCRCAAAEFFGMDLPERVVLTMNATHALNLVLFGILQRGDRVLYSDLAHNSVRRPIAALRERGVKSEMYSVLEKGALLPQAEIMRRLEALGITEGTKIRILNRKRNGACIIQVRGTRWAVGRQIARGIWIREQESLG